MKRRTLTPAILLVTVWLGADRAQSQTRVDLKTQGQNVDFRNATSTKPVKSGTALPASCETGELYYLVTAPSGQNLYGCSGSPGIWTMLGKLAALSGDVNGPPDAVVVKKIWNREVSSLAPAEGQCYRWRTATQLFEPARCLNTVVAQPGLVTLSSGDDVSVGLDTAEWPLLAGENTWTGVNDFGAATRTHPNRTGASDPTGACQPGETLFALTAGRFWVCDGDAVWRLVGGISSLNGQAGAVQTFAADTNVTLTSETGGVHRLGWTGVLGTARGGLGAALTPGAGLYPKGNGSAFGLSTLPAAGTGSCTANQYVQALNGDAAPSCAQPSVANLADGASVVKTTQNNTWDAGRKQTFQSSETQAGTRLAPAALPTSPTAGDLAVDSSDSNRLKYYDGNVWQTEGATLYARGKGAAVTLTGTSSDLDLPNSTVSLPAGRLAAGRCLRLSVSTFATGSGSKTFKLWLGSSSKAVISASTSTSQAWVAYVCNAVSATNVQSLVVSPLLSTAGLGSSIFDDSVFAVDTTVAQTLKLTANGTSGDTAGVRHILVEVLQ